MGVCSVVFLLTSTFIFSQVSSRAVNITSSWVLPQEGFPHFFRYFKDLTTWDDAKVICGSFHAELLTVESDERRDAARAYLKELDVLENIWCGLQRSSIEAPFVWTGGGQGPVVGDAFWQEGHPLEPERLCAAINPLYDFRWQSFPCSGPQLNSFVCQLPVPEWAEDCLVNSLPSLTVTYLPETAIIELLSDCGLSGTKRIACKGGEKQDELMKRLSCDGSDFSSTQGWSSKGSRHYDTSTPADIITMQMTRSSGTRHKRESGATFTSTDTTLLVSDTTQLATEQEVNDHRVPAPERLSPLDTTTLTATYAKEDQIEATTLSSITGSEVTSSPVKKQEELPVTEATTGLPTTIKQATNGNVHQWIHEDLMRLLEASSTSISAPTTIPPIAQTEETTKLNENLPLSSATAISSSESPPPKADIVTPPVAPRETSTVLPPVENIEVRLPHPPMIQHKDRNHKLAATPPPPVTVTQRAIVEVTPIDEKPPEVVMTTVENIELNDTEKNDMSRDNEVALQLPDKEALVSTNDLPKYNDVNWITIAIKTTVKQSESKTTDSPNSSENLGESSTPTTTTIKYAKEDYAPKNVPVIIIEEVDEIEIGDKQLSGTEEPELTSPEVKDTTESEVHSESQKLDTTEGTSVQPTYAVLDAGRPNQESIQVNTTEEDEKREESTVVALTNEPKDTVTETTLTREVNTEKHSPSGVTQKSEGTAAVVSTTQAPTPVQEQEAAAGPAAIELSKEKVPAAAGGEEEVVLSLSEESSEEAENPKRTSRSRLFPHSNPLSFYPYFFNKMLG